MSARRVKIMKAQGSFLGFLWLPGFLKTLGLTYDLFFVVWIFYELVQLQREHFS